MRKAASLALAAAAMAGCAVNKPPPASEAQIREYNTPLVCEGKDQCDLYWRKAQAWVLMNAGYKLQMATDMVIETFSAKQYYSTGWAMRVTRIPATKTQDRLVLEPSCGQAPICRGDYFTLVSDFNAYVRAATN